MRLKTHPLFCLHAHARGHPEGGCDGELLESHEELFKKVLHLFVDSSRGFLKTSWKVDLSVSLVTIRLDISCGFFVSNDGRWQLVKIKENTRIIIFNY